MLGAPPSPGRHDSALGITAMPGGYTSRRGLCLQPADTTRPWARLLRPGAAPHAGGSAFTRSARLRPKQDYCAGGLRRMLGAPPAPGRHDSALGATTTPGGYAACWGLRLHLGGERRPRGLAHRVRQVNSTPRRP
ncbi:Os02g0331666 [Oryza sativa Japonica Group]|uniref:Os02g0331666 protein n=1 Tax=Oryza sativa subsp. japonica TaxID=39947 RepID=A0A0N7KF76_ORYSJ|nr:Os02g0331666 [Oryza sativa Japonica Group]